MKRCVKCGEERDETAFLKASDRTLEIVRRLKKGERQAEIARAVGVNRTWVSQLAKGGPLRALEICKLCRRGVGRVVGVPIEDDVLPMLWPRAGFSVHDIGPDDWRPTTPSDWKLTGPDGQGYTAFSGWHHPTHGYVFSEGAVEVGERLAWFAADDVLLDRAENTVVFINRTGPYRRITAAMDALEPAERAA